MPSTLILAESSDEKNLAELLLTWCPMGDENYVDAGVAEGQIDEQGSEPPVSAGPDAEGGSVLAPRRKTAEGGQGETQPRQVVGVNSRNPPE